MHTPTPPYPFDMLQFIVWTSAFVMLVGYIIWREIRGGARTSSSGADTSVGVGGDGFGHGGGHDGGCGGDGGGCH